MARDISVGFKVSAEELEALEEQATVEGADSVHLLARDWVLDTLANRTNSEGNIAIYPLRIHRHLLDELRLVAKFSRSATLNDHIRQALENYKSTGVARHLAVIKSFLRAHPELSIDEHSDATLARKLSAWTRSR